MEGTVSPIFDLQQTAISPYLSGLAIPDETILHDSVLLLWNRGSLLDTPGFSHYEVWQGGALLCKTDKLGYRAEGLAPRTGYFFRVRAIGSDGAALSETGVRVSTKPSPPVLNVLEVGAAGDGRTLDTAALQKAVDICPQGGEVLLPFGKTFRSGALFLKSDMTMRVDGTLLGSENPLHYPRIV